MLKKYLKIVLVIICAILLFLLGRFISNDMQKFNESKQKQLKIEEEQRIKKENEKEEIITHYKRALDDKLVDFQVYREPRDKHLFTLFDATTNPDAVKYDHWIEYDVDTDSLVLNDYLAMDGSVQDIENEIRGEYSLAKSIKVSDKRSAPLHVTIKVYLTNNTNDNDGIVNTLAEYKDEAFTTNILNKQGEMYKGQAWYYKDWDLPKSK